MTSRDIQIELYRHFHNYDYKLLNSYIYDVSGECDFFAMSKSGYQVEVEIKVSRSDFFVDFKKPKHRFYKATFEKRTHLVEDLGRAKYPDPKSVFGSYVYSIPDYPYSFSGRRASLWGAGYQEREDHLQKINNYPGFTLRKMKADLWAEHHKIKIHTLDKVLIPHRLYYATPKGLIKIDEVPIYAGLIETDGYGAKEVKKAPYIHKRDQNITYTLLRKFYYECMDRRCGLTFLQKHSEQ